jgi:ergothioneine biosynthesis protein EgtB
MLATQKSATVQENLLHRVWEARGRSDALFGLVDPASLYNRPIPERHRIIFYVGHLEAFDWNLLHENVFGVKSFHPEFDRLFAFGIDPVGGGLPSDQPSDWPALEAVQRYTNKIRSALDQKLADETLDRSVPGGGFSLDTLLNVAVEHRLMHLETLAYMLHQLPLEKKARQTGRPEPVAAAVAPRMVEVPAGRAILGLVRGSEAFGWDNEYERHTVEVPAFEIDQYMVTNRQYLGFMAAGGYETRSLWTDDDWNWKAAHGISHPVFWKPSGSQWLYRAMFAELPLPLEWPVYVSYAEASAYARWKGKSLPTEREWCRAAYGGPEGAQRFYPWGNEGLNPALGNFDFERWDPAPVNSFGRGGSGFDAEGMLGNGWEWTSTVFAPFPGFEPFPFYRGYSSDFFDGKHFVMKGGSARTAACMLRPTFRNWFQAHYQYMYAGFRCVTH